jgi:hypothetical protein
VSPVAATFTSANKNNPLRPSEVLFDRMLAPWPRLGVADILGNGRNSWEKKQPSRPKERKNQKSFG